MLRRATALKRICDRQRVQNAANRLNIPVIAYSDVLDAKKGDIFDKIHPWIKECLATKLMFHADDVVQYVKDFYMVRY